MTKEACLEVLRRLAIQSQDDAEAAHEEADTLLLAFIDDPDITAAFTAIIRWYA